jgi:hypothetical protein
MNLIVIDRLADGFIWGKVAINRPLDDYLSNLATAHSLWSADNPSQNSILSPFYFHSEKQLSDHREHYTH